MKLSPDAVRTLLTSVFPPEFIDDCARECGVVEWDRDIDIRMLVWTLAVGFAVGGEIRSIAGYRRAYNAATNQSIAASSFYDAIEHGNSEVTVRIGELAGDSGFYVADDGPGIPKDSHEEIFESGYSITEDGTGFGLAIVREIIQAHDWDITVTDSNEGGARFEITGVEIAAE